MFDEFLDKARELRARGEAFATALVVRYEAPISGKPGDRAIVFADGRVWGWIGGGCAQPLVVKEALAALADGQPRLVRISPAPAEHAASGVVDYQMTCHSGGSLDIFVEPVLAKPHLLIIGRSAVAQNLARLAKAIGAKFTVAAGFLIIAVALGIGSRATLSSGAGFVAAWMALAGVGTGLTMATAASAALAELSEERAGVGSGVLQALKNTGAPLGSAILGSVLVSVYVSRLHLAGMAPLAAHAVRQSVFGGVAVARLLHSPALLTSVRAAFVHGTDVALLVSVGFALLGLALSLAFLPAHARPPSQSPGQRREGERVGV